MTPKALRAPDYLDHILEAIGRIQRYTRETTQEAFLANEQQQDAVIRNIEIIGEASRNLQGQAPDLVAQHTDIPWAALYAMRNRVAHGYWAVDVEIVWNVIKDELPILKTQIQALLKDAIELPGSDCQ
jgi:uncharacterized protein with HEPN domain